MPLFGGYITALLLISLPEEEVSWPEVRFQFDRLPELLDGKVVTAADFSHFHSETFCQMAWQRYIEPTKQVKLVFVLARIRAIIQAHHETMIRSGGRWQLQSLHPGWTFMLNP